MKIGDLWTCSACGQIIACDEWGIRHSGRGHSINFRKEHHQDAIQLHFELKTPFKNINEYGQISIF